MSQTLIILYEGIHYFLRVIQLMMMVRAVLSWITRPDNRLYRFLAVMTEPIITPFRILVNRIVKRPMMFDIAYILAYFALSLMDRLIFRILFSL